MSTQVLTLEHDSRTPGVFAGGSQQKIRLAIESDSLTNPRHLADVMGAAVVAMETLLGRDDVVKAEVVDDDEQPSPSPDDEVEMDETRVDDPETPILVTLPGHVLDSLSSLSLVPVPSWAVRKFIPRGILATGD